ncbi:MAG: 30S ribosomal protein S12 methylthiotransferase RimO [Planctomycetaceae bacterium]|jgi:ribosomal protein S12 methylthiotransferase|nr:30S ribosomal protein S12 methylthiotransferase RimO [Planctomycetaceae bacterium]
MIKNGTFSLVSLGCPKNLVDSEQIVFALKQTGLNFQTDVDNSELAVLNTCGFLRSARDEAKEYIRALIGLKKEGRIKKISVRGCMVKFEGIENLAAEFPDVDDWGGVPVNGEQEIQNEKWNRTLLTVPHTVYLRIADGCSRRCSFCAIPDIRGPFRSVPMETVLREAEHLAANGVKELAVIAQETTFWGTDLCGKPQLTKLLQKLEEIDGIRWIRLMYSYPQHFEDELIGLFASGGKLLPYIDMPLQHAADEMLQRMNRRVTKAETETLLDKLRSAIPNLVLRTSLIAGFPGETEAMFQELLRFVERWKFERAGVFRFSPEKGTPAAVMDQQVPLPVVNRRYEHLYKTCEKYSTAWANRQKGKILPVQIDGNYVDDSGRKETHVFIGRTFADAPDIDPVVYVTGEKLEQGSLIDVEILETEGCDLVGAV